MGLRDWLGEDGLDPNAKDKTLRRFLARIAQQHSARITIPLLVLVALALLIFSHISLASLKTPEPAVSPSPTPEPIHTRIACIGDSITRGVFGENKPVPYPRILQQMLGAGFEVMNFGEGGVTVQNAADKPYVKTAKYAQALDYPADVIVFMMGTNDAARGNWDEERFVADARALIDTFTPLLTPEPDQPFPFFVGLQPPVYPPTRADIRTDVINQRLPQDIWPQLASSLDLPVIDLFTAMGGRGLERWELFCSAEQCEAIHPNTVGNTQIAATVFRALVDSGVVKPAFSQPFEHYRHNTYLQQDV